VRRLLGRWILDLISWRVIVVGIVSSLDLCVLGIFYDGVIVVITPGLCYQREALGCGTPLLSVFLTNTQQFPPSLASLTFIIMSWQQIYGRSVGPLSLLNKFGTQNATRCYEVLPAFSTLHRYWTSGTQSLGSDSINGLGYLVWH
jgi:hypothetical protein